MGDERALLEAFLDWNRQTLLWKCSGLTADQLKTAAAPSTLTLHGLVRHLTDVEQWWFNVRAAGQPEHALYCTDESPDGDFDDIAGADPEADIAAFRAQWQESRDAVAALSLDHTFWHPRYEKQISVRWVYLHMLEEYARHNGHADLIRERIDGATGQ
jgi:uncharacterized damage-inducible protein DinB